MERTTAAVGVATLIGIVALAMAAATVTAPTPTVGGGGGGSGTGGGFAIGQTDPAFGAVEVPYLREVLVLIGLVLAIVAVAYLFVHRREAFRLVVGIGVLAVVLLGLADLVGRALGPVAAPIANRSGGLPPGDPGGPAGPATAAPSLPVLVGLLVLAGVLVALGLRRLADTEAAVSAAPTERAAAMGRAAGRAADRIESSGDIGNEVYRAWVEMTELLDVAAPESTTAGQFAAAAVDAGLDPGDVDELTELFEDVRYGGRPVTGLEERRAVAVLRRIEAGYAEADG